MKRRSILLACLAFVYIFSLIAPLAEAARTVPPEVKSYTIKFMNEFGGAMRTLADNVRKTDDPVRIAAAVNAYCDTIEPLIQGMAELEKKYPDFFEEMDEDDEIASSDPDIARAEAEFEKAFGTIMSTFMTIAAHADHPQVEAAMERLENAMALMDEEY